MSRILIHEPRHAPDECQDLLSGLGHDVVVCRSREALFDALVIRRPDLVVYVLNHPVGDLAMLSLVRRIAPDLPLILLGDGSDLAARRRVQELRPTYYGVFPLDPAELRDAVRGALSHHGCALAS